MTVHAIPGRLFLGPFADVADGGTLIDGIEERLFNFNIEEQLITMRSSLSADPKLRTYRHRSGAAVLTFSAQNQEDVETLKILLAQLTTDGLDIRPEGGTSTNQFAKLPSFPAVVRPLDDSAKHIYSPAWTLHPETAQALATNDLASYLSSSEITLVAGQTTNGTGPSYMIASASAINTAYGL